jgi:hypothetical protein
MTPKIDLMIVGAPKSGTTSVLRYLAAHPDITTHRQAEFGYFLNDRTYADGMDKAVTRFFGKELRKVLVAKHVALMYFDKSVARLYEHNPSVQAVALLRHPLNRAYSEYWYSRKQGWEEIETFEEAIELEQQNDSRGWNGRQPRSYLFYSMYHPHIARLFKVLKKQQVHVFLTEDLKNDTESFYSNLLVLVHLQPDQSIDIRRRFNEAAKPRYPKLAQLYAKVVYAPNSLLKRSIRPIAPKRWVDLAKKSYVDWNREAFEPPPMDPRTRERLIAYFKLGNQILGELLGRDLDFWNS